MASSTTPPFPEMEFRLEPALERRDPSSVITAVALDDEGGRIYVGTSDGVLEEWNRPAGGGRAVLGARRHVGGSKKPVAAITYVGAARKVAVLVDGHVFLLDEETLDAVPLPAGGGWRGGGGGGVGSVGSVVVASGLVGSKEAPVAAAAAPSATSNSGGITAIAAAPPGGNDPLSASCLAVAGRARGRLLSGGGGSSRAAVFFVVPGKGGSSAGSASSSSTKSSPPGAVCAYSVEWGEPLAVTTVAWAGRGALVLGSALRYSLWKLPQSLSLAQSLAAAVAAAAAGGVGAGAPSPSSAVVPLLELSADAPAATPVALSLPSLYPSPPRLLGRWGQGEAASASASASAARIPTAVLLLVERAGVAVGADGMPARGRPGAATFAEAPTALATVAGGLAVAAACPSGVLLHDAVTGSKTGFLAWPQGATPARGQRLLATSLNSPISSSSSSSASCASSVNSFALISGMRRAWVLVPVSARERAVAALGAGRFEEAAAAALASLGAWSRGSSASDQEQDEEEDEEEEGLETGYSWQEDVAAEAGLALLSRALSHLSSSASAAAAAAAAAAATSTGTSTTTTLMGRALSASSLHPAELFPLLPGESAPWAREAERAAALSAELRRGRLRGGVTAAGAAATLLSPLLSPLAPGKQNAAVTAEVSRAMLTLRKRMIKKKGENVDDESSLLREGIDTVAVVLAARAVGEEEEEKEEEDEEGDELEIVGKNDASGDRRKRKVPPLSLSALLRSPSLRARMNVVSPALEAAGEHAALAAALARRASGASGGDGGGGDAAGAAASALRVWREVAEGKRKVKGGDAAASAAALAAAEAAADFLSDRRRAPAALVAENVPWLLSAGRQRKKSCSSVAAPAAATGGAESSSPPPSSAASSSSASASASFSSLFSSSSSVSPSAILEEWPLPPAARALLSRRRRRSGGRDRKRTAAAAAARGEKRGSESGGESEEDDPGISTARALRLLPAETAPEARAAYLAHLVFGGGRGNGGRRRIGGDGENESESEGESESEAKKSEAATELALLLVSLAASLLPSPTPSAADGKSLPPLPAWKRAEAVRARLGDSPPPVSANGGEAERRGGSLARARRALRALLLSREGSLSSFPLSLSLDLASVSGALSRTDLWEERAAAQFAAGDAEAAARTLLLVCRDPEAAVEVALRGRLSTSSGSSSSAVSASPLLAPDALLSTLLNPGEGRAPLLEDAVALLDCVTGMMGARGVGGGGSERGEGTRSHGGNGATTRATATPLLSPSPLLLPPLDASSILSAMGDSTPLCQVQPHLRRLLRARVRGRRAATFAKALARAEALAAAAEKSLIAAKKAATVDEGKCCRDCGAKIGLKVFAVVPNGGKGGGAGVVCCMRCVREGKTNER